VHAQQPKPKRDKPNRTPLTHTRSFSASRHRSLLASLRYSFVFRRSSCFSRRQRHPPVLPNPAKSPSNRRYSSRPQPPRWRDPALDSQLREGARKPAACAAAWWRPQRLRKDANPATASKVSTPLCPLSRSATGRKGREGGWAHLTGARRRRRARGRPGPLAYGCVVGRPVVAKTQGELTPDGVNLVTENKRLNRES
jgi:hypothetical protein